MPVLYGEYGVNRFFRDCFDEIDIFATIIKAVTIRNLFRNILC